MASSKDPAVLVYTWWERFLNAQSELFGGDREFTALSDKLNEIRSSLFADREVTADEMETLIEKMEAVGALYAKLAARRGIALDSSAPSTRDSFRVFREAAEIHFQTLAGTDGENYRGGLLREWIHAGHPESLTQRIVLDLLTSASTAISLDKVNLLRAQLSMLGDGARQRTLLNSVRDRLARELARPVWTARGARPAILPEEFDEVCGFRSAVAARSVPLPAEARATNRMLPNRPLAGWEAVNRIAVKALLADLRASGNLFLDAIPASHRPIDVAVKIELNLGIEGPPSVTDPAATYSVLAELLEMAEARGLRMGFTVGDSNGIENAPVGRTSMDVMRETGNYHAALKAGLEFAVRHSMPEPVRVPASASLEKLIACEQASPPVYFGSADDRISSPRDLEAAETAASPWVTCVDYDRAGFRAVVPEFGPLAAAVWGTKLFQIAEPWVTADYRVHVTRGVSNHVFAGWTGALKGLVGLHALGGRPADQGMKQRGESPLDVMTAVMRSGSFTGLFAARCGLPDFSTLVSACQDSECLSVCEKAVESWNAITQFADGRSAWADGCSKLEAQLRAKQTAGAPEVEIMAQMRTGAAALLAEAERRSPGFRASLWQGVADGTRAFLLTMWRMRGLIPPEMRDERIGLRIGLLSRLPYPSNLVVQGLPKIGLGGGPDAYFDVRDVGVMIAGTDEISVDVTALRLAGIAGNPWEYNQPIHGALQFGRGPMCREEIQDVTREGSPAQAPG